MFIVMLTYVRPLEEIDRVVEAHNAYLDRNYQEGRFLASGRRVPRTGGVILARAATRAEVEAAVAEDLFIVDGLAQYEIIEFVPSKGASEFTDTFRRQAGT